MKRETDASETMDMAREKHAERHRQIECFHHNRLEVQMTKVTARSAREFVNAVELPALKRGGFESVPVTIDYEAQKNQALVVASDVVSFVKGVTNERRQDIVNSSLLAQLAASKKVPDKKNIIDWYNAYFDVLENIGWAIQERNFSAYTQEANGLETHEAILKAATAFLGPTATALAVVTSILDAIKSMDSNSSWLKIFDQETKSAETAHFQIALAEQSDDGQFFVSLMAFSLKANASITQILFFKIRKDELELQKCLGKVTINEDVLVSVRDRLKQKLAAHANDYIAKLPDLG